MKEKNEDFLSDDFMPVSVLERLMEKKSEAEREQTETKRFIITTAIGIVAAVASVVGATVSILSFFS